MTTIIIALAAAALVLLVAYWAIATSNRFKVMLIKIGEAGSGIDVALTKRYDTLTKMLEVTKGYAKFEGGVLTEVISLRSGMSMSEKNEVSRKMDDIMGKINVLVENYPNLQASDSFLRLKRAISDSEQHLQAARRAYNMNVSMYNQAIVVFPNSIVAGKTHTAQEFFVADEEKRGDVKMVF